jgi:hypothetical protein
MPYLCIGGAAGFIIEVKYLATQKNLLLVDFENLEAFPALGDDIHASIGMFLSHRDYLSCAPYVGQITLRIAHDPEPLFLFKAFGNHFFITGLKDVERKRRTGKEHQVKGK